MMNIVLKDKLKVDKNFINDLITKSWQDSESIQNQINSIEVDSAIAVKTAKLLKDLLTSYYVFIGCLENLENEPVKTIEPEPAKVIEPEIIVPEKLTIIPEEPMKACTPDTDIFVDYNPGETIVEPFEYFVDFDEPVGKPLTDDDLYN